MTTVAVRKNSKTYDMVYIGVFAVLMAICSWISIPVAIPFTLQTLGVCLCGGILGIYFAWRCRIAGICRVQQRYRRAVGADGRIHYRFYLFYAGDVGDRGGCRKKNLGDGICHDSGNNRLLCVWHSLVYDCLWQEWRADQSGRSSGNVCNPLFTAGSFESCFGFGNYQTAGEGHPVITIRGEVKGIK